MRAVSSSLTGVACSKVFEHVGIVSDLAAVDAEGLLRHLLDRFFPFIGCSNCAAGRIRASRLAAIINSRFHSARIGSAYFQLRTSPCSVTRIWPEKQSWRLGENRGVSGSAAATDRAAAAMKEAQLHVDTPEPRA